jgi:hypothetical protein
MICSDKKETKEIQKEEKTTVKLE